MAIWIDADGCPVVDQTVQIGREAGETVWILCDTSHEFEREGARTVVVSKGADSVDFALVNRIGAGDIVVTQDYGLAAMCLARRARPIRQDGLLYTAENIDALLTERHTAGKLRRAGTHLKGPRKRTAQEDAQFSASLRVLLGMEEPVRSGPSHT